LKFKKIIAQEIRGTINSGWT